VYARCTLRPGLAGFRLTTLDQIGIASRKLQIISDRSAFDSTSEYEKLKDFNWDESKDRLLATLRTKIKPWRQINLDLTRRVRNNHDLHVRYFAVSSVMPTKAVEAFFQQREASDESTRSAMLSITTQASENLSNIQDVCRSYKDTMRPATLTATSIRRGTGFGRVRPMSPRRF